MIGSIQRCPFCGQTHFIGDNRSPESCQEALQFSRYIELEEPKNEKDLEELKEILNSIHEISKTIEK